MSAPLTISLRVCPVCGRNDRFTPFTGKSHYVAGQKCSGEPQKWVYTRAKVPA